MISNDELLARRSKQRGQADRPSVGDFVIFPDPSAPRASARRGSPTTGARA
ncbi:hypothetical protein [Rubrobacter marinus]|uniref:hypothetical protein n=1 Tax=Rubrobacter marinus TaxID=2653852 RepID=UPI001407C6CA|nr:hypothetical protein [Rubrobacter marinus]